MVTYVLLNVVDLLGRELYRGTSAIGNCLKYYNFFDFLYYSWSSLPISICHVMQKHFEGRPSPNPLHYV